MPRAATYTPGPWWYDPEEPAIRFWKDGEVGIVVNLQGAMGGDDTEADARLMTESPELLESLEELVKLADEATDHLPTRLVYVMTTAVEGAREVIRRAKGGL